MQNELDGKFLLGVFGKVEKNGIAITNELGAGFVLDGITVNSGFDGFEVFFSDLKVQVSFCFHT